MADQPQFSDTNSIESKISNQEHESTITYREQEHDSIPERPDYEVAMQYVLSVEKTFNNGEEFQHFDALISDSTAKRCTLPVVVSRMKLLFSEHEELIEGINQYLPEGYKIALPLTRRADISMEATISTYIHKVKVAFSQEEERYAAFLQLITGYGRAEMSLQELSEKIYKLLSDRQDLLEEFFDYMPSYRETLHHAKLTVQGWSEASKQHK